MACGSLSPRLAVVAAALLLAVPSVAEAQPVSNGKPGAPARAGKPHPRPARAKAKPTKRAPKHAKRPSGVLDGIGFGSRSQTAPGPATATPAPASPVAPVTTPKA